MAKSNATKAFLETEVDRLREAQERLNSRFSLLARLLRQMTASFDLPTVPRCGRTVIASQPRVRWHMLGVLLLLLALAACGTDATPTNTPRLTEQDPIKAGKVLKA